MNHSEKLDIELLQKNISGEVYYKEVTGSTNMDAKQTQEAPDKSLFLSDMQTDGRGRMGRSWASQGGEGILMSIHLIPEISIQNIPQITLIAGLAVSRVIESSFIKWPNDVLIDDKKVCGILTESTIEANGKIRVIVGIGINVNNQDFPDDLKDKATSIFLLTKEKSNREDIIIRVYNEFVALYESFAANGFSVFMDEYRKKCITLGREVIIIENEKSFIAKAVDIAENGELLIENNGKIQCINSREVSVRGLLGYN